MYHLTDSISTTTFDEATKTDHGPISSPSTDETSGVSKWHTTTNSTMMHGMLSPTPFKIWEEIIVIDAGLGPMIIPCRIGGRVPMLPFGGMGREVHCRCMWIWVRFWRGMWGGNGLILCRRMLRSLNSIRFAPFEVNCLEVACF